MSTMFQSCRVNKSSLIRLIEMLATAEDFYNQDRKEDTLLDLQAFLSDPKNILKGSGSESQTNANPYSPLTVAALQLKTAISGMTRTETKGPLIPAPDKHEVMTYDVAKLPAFKVFSGELLKVIQSKPSSTFARYALPIRLKFELVGAESPDMIRRFHQTKTEAEGAKVLTMNIYNNRHGFPISQKK